MRKYKKLSAPTWNLKLSAPTWNENLESTGRNSNILYHILYQIFKIILIISSEHIKQ